MRRRPPTTTTLVALDTDSQPPTLPTNFTRIGAENAIEITGRRRRTIRPTSAYYQALVRDTRHAGEDRIRRAALPDAAHAVRRTSGLSRSPVAEVDAGDPDDPDAGDRHVAHARAARRRVHLRRDSDPDRDGHAHRGPAERRRRTRSCCSRSTSSATPQRRVLHETLTPRAVDRLLGGPPRSGRRRPGWLLPALGDVRRRQPADEHAARLPRQHARLDTAFGRWLRRRLLRDARRKIDRPRHLRAAHRRRRPAPAARRDRAALALAHAARPARARRARRARSRRRVAARAARAVAATVAVVALVLARAAHAQTPYWEEQTAHRHQDATARRRRPTA